jgi:hypothetical protein
MGYDFHITRASERTDSESVPIRLDEWKAFLESHPEFRMDNFAEATTPQGDIIRYDNEGLAVWTGYSGHGKDGNIAWFDFRGGRIVVKNADDEIRVKMKEIAEFFQARVIGDEGEEY